VEAEGSRGTRPLDAARRRLAAKHLALAVGRGAAWARYGGLEYPDLVGAAQLGLVKAAGAYRRGGGRTFPWWARIWIDAECRRELRSQGRYRGKCEADDEALAEAADPTSPPEPAPELLEAWAALPDRQREVLVLRFSEGLTYVAAGKVLGMSSTGVLYAERSAIAALRAALGPEEGPRWARPRGPDPAPVRTRTEAYGHCRENLTLPTAEAGGFSVQRSQPSCDGLTRSP
jgi:RNA polymerase sigma factor (sigma-70 family)